MLKGRLPGSRGEPAEEERETLDELEYAGELMVVQYLSLIRTFMKPR